MSLVTRFKCCLWAGARGRSAVCWHVTSGFARCLPHSWRCQVSVQCSYCSLLCDEPVSCGRCCGAVLIACAPWTGPLISSSWMALASVCCVKMVAGWGVTRPINLTAFSSWLPPVRKDCHFLSFICLFVC